MTIILLVVPIIIALYVANTYNRIIRMQEMVKNSTAQIATQIESRWDVLSSLIDMTNKYVVHEAKTLESITQNRQKISRDSNVGEVNESETNYQNSLSRLMAVSESYPNLKASHLYQETMKSINKYEDNVKLSRMTFNDTVTKYNRVVKTVPTNIVAKITGFKEEDYLEVSKEKKEMPTW